VLEMACQNAGLGCDLGRDGFWKGDYGWEVRVRRHFGLGTPPFLHTREELCSLWYGTRLGDLKENWFLLFFN
jgi:hypothetical protein